MIQPHRALAAVALAAGMLVAAVPAQADEAVQPEQLAVLSITGSAQQALTSGQLSLDAVGPADEPEPQVFTMPVVSVTFTKTGAPRAVRLTGGVRIVGEPEAVDLTELRVRMPARLGSVKVSSPDARIPAFDVARLKTTRKKVSGVLLVAPGTSAVLNAEFDTYVFSDGMRFARFEVTL